jgi:hypothetical protein
MMPRGFGGCLTEGSCPCALCTSLTVAPWAGTWFERLTQRAWDLSEAKLTRELDAMARGLDASS